MSEKYFSPEYQKRNTESTINSLGSVAVTLSGLSERLNLPGFVPEKISDDQKKIITESLARISILHSDISGHFVDQESNNTAVNSQPEITPNNPVAEANPKIALEPQELPVTQEVKIDNNQVVTTDDSEETLPTQSNDPKFDALINEFNIRDGSKISQLLPFIYNSDKPVTVADICKELNINDYDQRDSKGRISTRNNIATLLNRYSDMGLFIRERESSSEKSKSLYSINKNEPSLEKVEPKIIEASPDSIFELFDQIKQSPDMGKFDSQTKELLSFISLNLNEVLSPDSSINTNECLDRIRVHFDTILTSHRMPSANARALLTDALIEFGKLDSQLRKR